MWIFEQKDSMKISQDILASFAVFFIFLIVKYPSKRGFTYRLLQPRHSSLRNPLNSYGAKYSRMDQLKFVEGSL